MKKCHLSFLLWVISGYLLSTFVFLRLCIWEQFPVSEAIIFSVLMHCTTVYLEKGQELRLQVVWLQIDGHF